MTTIERIDSPDSPMGQDDEIAVTIVDTDVHPLPVSADVLKSYAPAEWVDKIWPTGNAVSPVPHFYDTPDSYKTMSLRVDASPPGPSSPRISQRSAATTALVTHGAASTIPRPAARPRTRQAGWRHGRCPSRTSRAG